jgi:16S rRNA (cytidine1402-2'-O)-methyltransferase
MLEKQLYIIATPIGTLNDLSPRAKEVLSTVSYIVCEDTRHTRKILHAFKIKATLESLHKNNEKTKSAYLIDKLLQSPHSCAALVSDAGTPCISDPGALLVSLAHQKGIKVLSVPGPSSVPCALAASGFLQPRWIFSGFLEKNKKNQFQEFQRWRQIAPCVAIFFESPKRLLASLKNILEFFENTSLEACVSRELSKKFEEHQRNTLTKLIECFSTQKELKGEFVICVNLLPCQQPSTSITPLEAALEAHIISQKGVLLKNACKHIALKYHLNSKEIYFQATQIKKTTNS